MEFGTTSRLAQGTAAAVQFGVDPQDALDKIGKLQERLSTLEQVGRAAAVGSFGTSVMLWYERDSCPDVVVACLAVLQWCCSVLSVCTITACQCLRAATAVQQAGRVT